MPHAHEKFWPEVSVCDHWDKDDWRLGIKDD